jgi:hypothetical protein
MKQKAIKFNGEKYLEEIYGKEHYVWDPNSEFGNLIPVRVIKEGKHFDKGMGRPISAVLVVFKLNNEATSLFRNMVALDHTMPLEQALKEINKIVEYAKNDAKRYHAGIGEAVEAHLVPMEYYEDIINYNFLLSEIFDENDPYLGQVIELMRAAEHIKHITTILVMIPDDEKNDENEIYWDSTRVFAFNLAASMLREALRPLYDFMKSDFYKEIKDMFDERGQKAANYLEVATNINDKNGLLKIILIPLRNATFHYDHKLASEWGKKRIEMETQEKPPISSLTLSDQITNCFFGPGADFDGARFQEHWIFGREELFKAQTEIILCQLNFIYFVRTLCTVLMDRAKISNERSFDFFMKYRYGYERL